MKIAVVGSGISGLACAWLLATQSGRAHHVTLFEQAGYLGGHSNTVEVTVDGLTHPVDTGFLVFNDWTYPNFIELLRVLEVESAPSDMSFSIKLTDDRDHGRIEWSGSRLATIFVQPSNLFRPAFVAMLADLLRFNKQALALVVSGQEMGGTLGQFLDEHRYGPSFRNWYLLPMAACIWSTPTRQINDFPLTTFLTFCRNHGLLSINRRPQWRTVVNGAHTYVKKMAAAISDIRLQTPVVRITRHAAGVAVVSAGNVEQFDQVILACHTDQSLTLLADADEAERGVLSAIPYQSNRALLHTDATLLPDRKNAWAAWNYMAPYRVDKAIHASSPPPVALSYLLNKLQPLPFASPVMVTMNPPRAPRPDKVIAEFIYDHPLYLPSSVVAQRNLSALQGRRRTWFAGAWTGYGFHEDGLLSGMRIALSLGAKIPWQSNVAPALPAGRGEP